MQGIAFKEYNDIIELKIESRFDLDLNLLRNHEIHSSMRSNMNITQKITSICKYRTD